MVIRIIENDVHPAHKDLYINIPELLIDKYVDTYYFLYDTGILPNEETDYKTRALLNYLLQEWIKSINSLNNNDITFLPFDFSDQYVGALKIQRQNNKLIIHEAWNPVLGGMSPSRYNKFKMIDEDFNILPNRAEIQIKKFIHDIEQQRAFLK